jgi:hypothetical protein
MHCSQLLSWLKFGAAKAQNMKEYHDRFIAYHYHSYVMDSTARHAIPEDRHAHTSHAIKRIRLFHSHNTLYSHSYIMISSLCYNMHVS